MMVYQQAMRGGKETGKIAIPPQQAEILLRCAERTLWLIRYESYHTSVKVPAADDPIVAVTDLLNSTQLNGLGNRVFTPVNFRWGKGLPVETIFCLPETEAR